MAQYIDKSALIAEIEKIIEEPAPSHDQQCPWEDGYYCGLYKAENIIDTLEVKKVNLQEEVRKWQQKHFEGIGYVLDGSGGWIGRTSLLDIAEYFFELGLKEQKQIKEK